MKSSILYVTMVLSGLITLFACVTVEPQAEVNIDATVEARVAKEISDTQPTSTPEVIATVVPNPEPTPTPIPPTVKEILDSSPEPVSDLQPMKCSDIEGMKSDTTTQQEVDLEFRMLDNTGNYP